MTTDRIHSHPQHPARVRVRRFAAAVTATTLAGLLTLTTGVGQASAQVGKSYDASVDQTIADIQSYWSTTMPSVYGTAYQAIPASRVYPYSESNPPPNCDDAGQTTAPYQDVAGNAFYCSNGDFVAYDEQGLIPKLRSQYGEFAVGLVFAHELGHAVQARVGYQPSATVYLEQQADCFAGAWAQHVATSNDANVHLAKSDLDTALAGLLALRDPSGVDGSQDGAHGNGFDRVSAFQDGFEGGAATCAAYQNDPPTERLPERRQPAAQPTAALGHEEPRDLLDQRDVEVHRRHQVGGRQRGARRGELCDRRPGCARRRGRVLRVDRHHHLRRATTGRGARRHRRLRPRGAARDGVRVVGAARARA
jgi:predicted metalloprotease